MLALNGHCSVKLIHELKRYQLKSIWNAFSSRTKKFNLKSFGLLLLFIQLIFNRVCVCVCKCIQNLKCLDKFTGDIDNIHQSSHTTRIDIAKVVIREYDFLKRTNKNVQIKTNNCWSNMK